MPAKRTISRPVFQVQSSEVLCQEVKRHTQMLKQEEDAIRRAAGIFTDSKRIWPDQCKYIIMLLERMFEPVQYLCAILENPEYLPLSVVTQRHVPLMNLQQAEKLITELLPLITHLRSTSQTSKKAMLKQQEDVQQGFAALVRSYEEVLPDILAVSDQLRFQTRKSAAPSRYHQLPEDASEGG